MVWAVGMAFIDVVVVVVVVEMGGGWCGGEVGGADGVEVGREGGDVCGL